MTNNKPGGANLVVVDGSNIATEGRSVPSLAQLNDAVLSLTHEFPEITVTVVVDATFGHRIDKSEVAEFDEAVAHNELVTPPAGAIGRGDAFVLSIANKVGARIFSNDSFQEFHGVYPWLFDEGRLIGGKPVPHVGWVFVNRVPVKGPLSRKARTAANDGESRRAASRLASLPMPVPTSPPPRRTTKSADPEPASARGRRRRGAETRGAEPVPATGRDAVSPAVTAAPVIGGPVNDLLPFLDFVEHHPVGTSVTGAVESYSSHGAYVTIGEVRGYVPLRLMGSPPPRSAREVMRMGEMVTLAVASFAPGRRSVDLAVPGFAPIPTPEIPAERASKRRAKQAASDAPLEELAGTSRRGRKKTSAADAPPTETPTLVTDEAKPAGKRAAPAKQVAAPTPAKKSPARKSPAEKSPAEKSPAQKSAATKTAATKSAAEKSRATKTAAKKTAAKKTAAKKTAAKKTAATTSAADTTEPPSRSAKRSRAKQAATEPDSPSEPTPQPASRRARNAAATAPAASVESAPDTPSKRTSRRRRSQPTAAD